MVSLKQITHYLLFSLSETNTYKKTKYSIVSSFADSTFKHDQKEEVANWRSKVG